MRFEFRSLRNVCIATNSQIAMFAVYCCLCLLRERCKIEIPRAGRFLILTRFQASIVLSRGLVSSEHLLCGRDYQICQSPVNQIFGRYEHGDITIEAGVIRLDMRLFDLTILDKQRVALGTWLTEDGGAVKREIQCVGKGRVWISDEADLNTGAKRGGLAHIPSTHHHPRQESIFIVQRAHRIASHCMMHAPPVRDGSCLA